MIYIMFQTRISLPLNDASRNFGLYKTTEKGEALNLVMPIWNWGLFMKNFSRAFWQDLTRTRAHQSQKALNYWWGISSGL